MRPGPYLKQLEADLEKWAASGLIDRERIPALLAAAGPAETKRSLAPILAFLGAILLACAAVAFVGANWQVMPRLVKLSLLITAMWLIYGLSVAALRREQPFFAQAAIVLAIAMFGANVMLVGQIYHINAGWPTGVLVWGLGALGAAFIIPSRSAAAFAAGLLTLWTVSCVTEFHWIFHWPFLPLLALIVSFGLWQRWPPIIHLALIGFGIWSVTNAVSLADHYDTGTALVFFGLLGLSLLIWLLGRLLTKHRLAFGNIVSGYGLFAVTVATFALQWSETRPLSFRTVVVTGIATCLPLFGLAARVRVSDVNPRGLRWLDYLMLAGLMITGLGQLSIGYPLEHYDPYVLAVLYFVFIAWLIQYGLSRQRTFPVNLALVAFAAEVCVLYFMTFHSLLDKSALFAIGGVLFIGAAVVLERVRSHLLRSAS